jgi:hypothetical protein
MASHDLEADHIDGCIDRGRFSYNRITPAAFGVRPPDVSTALRGSPWFFADLRARPVGNPDTSAAVGPG